MQTEFKTIFTQAKNVCDSLDIEIAIPKTTKFQKHRCNVPTSDPESYYRISVFIPFIDDLISSLTDRFLSQETTIISLQYILPEKYNVPYKHIEKSLLFYKDDLPDPHEDTLKGEWCLWQRKWLLENEKPKTAIGALAKCDKRRFPNIATLLNILAVLPVSTATVERTFSTLRRLKTYLRNSVGEDHYRSCFTDNSSRSQHRSQQLKYFESPQSKSKETEIDLIKRW